MKDGYRMIELRMGFFFTPYVWPASVGLLSVADVGELEAARKRYWAEQRKTKSA